MKLPFDWYITLSVVSEGLRFIYLWLGHSGFLQVSVFHS